MKQEQGFSAENTIPPLTKWLSVAVRNKKAELLASHFSSKVSVPDPSC